MTLGELITLLEALPHHAVLKNGIVRPHSYRGHYEQLAFEVDCDVPVLAMLQSARHACGSVFHGWKGGEYTMGAHSPVWRADVGELGEELTADFFVACSTPPAVDRPSVLYRPKLSIDGDAWCALYGDNLQEGCAGFGGSPAEAMADFDAEWVRKLGER